MAAAVTMTWWRRTWAPRPGSGRSTSPSLTTGGRGISAANPPGGSFYPPRAGLTRSDQIFTSCFLDLQIHDKLFKQHDIRDDQGSRACTIVLLISALVSPDTMLLMTVALERIGLGIAGCWAHGARVRAGEVFCHVQTLDTQPPTLSTHSLVLYILVDGTSSCRALLECRVQSNS